MVWGRQFPAPLGRLHVPGRQAQVEARIGKLATSLAGFQWIAVEHIWNRDLSRSAALIWFAFLLQFKMSKGIAEDLQSADRYRPRRGR